MRTAFEDGSSVEKPKTRVQVLDCVAEPNMIQTAKPDTDNHIYSLVQGREELQRLHALHSDDVVALGPHTSGATTQVHDSAFEADSQGKTEAP